MSQPDTHGEQQQISEITARTGAILRTLHDSLQQLGLDKTIADVAGSIPDARERLGYVVTLTRDAADGVINSVEITQPMQTQLSENAEQLTQRWEASAEPGVNGEQGRALAADTRAWLDDVPRITALTQQQLHAIMMAQGFQDLTGQIVQRMMAVLNQCEQQLIQIIRDKSASAGISPAPTQPSGSAEKAASQDDVDDLLASLGI